MQLFHLNQIVVFQTAGGFWVSHFPLQKIDMKNEAGTSMSVPIDITDDTLASSLVPVQCASLAPPAGNNPCCQKHEAEKDIYLQEENSSNRSFTSLQMFHMHATLPRGHFVQHMHEASICSYTFPEAGCFNEIKRQGKKCKWIGRNAQYGSCITGWS